MTASDIEILKVYVLIAPVLVVLLALGVMWLTGWLDRREDRRREQRSQQLARAARVAVRRLPPSESRPSTSLVFIAIDDVVARQRT